jgi:hypothetical protein
MKTFPDILKEKRDYYGNTEAAIEFAAEEYSQQNEKEILERLKFEGEMYNEQLTMLYRSIKVKLI